MNITAAANVSKGRPWRLAAWVIAALLMLLPAVAMRFTEEVKWSPLDFVFMGVLLFGTLGLYEVAVRLSNNMAYRAGVAVALLTSVVLVWINGAVGIIGDGPINGLYLGVILVGMLGAILAQLKPAGMARAMIAMALAQMTVPVIALLTRQPFAPGVAAVFMLNGVFAVAYVGAGALFQAAARNET